MKMREIRIISRNSKLALWQASFVKQKLTAIKPDLKVNIIGVTTEGDRRLDVTLDKIGGKGLFIKELEHALLNDIADIAVHSLKDLPVDLPEQFSIAAILEREDVHDAYISNNYSTILDMPDGAVIGTSSFRRVAFLKKYYPHLQTKLLRGNVDTRLNKLDNGEYNGIILAAVGLQRLGLADRIKQILDVDQFIPAIGQGALAIEILQDRDDLSRFLLPLIHQETAVAVAAEREVGRILGADCSVPIAVHASLLNEQITINAMLANTKTGVCNFAKATGNKDKYLEVAEQCAKQLVVEKNLNVFSV